MWKNDLLAKNRIRLNTRVLGKNNLTLPSTFKGDAAYACTTNKERNAIWAQTLGATYSILIQILMAQIQNIHQNIRL